MSINSVNPYTGKVIKEYKPYSLTECEKKIDAARERLESWKKLSIKKRASYIARISRVLGKNQEECAKTITSETGKPIRESLAEVSKCIWLCEYYSYHGPKFLKGRKVKTKDYKKSYVTYEPLGVILGIIPWNYPLWQALRFIIPTILSGNVILLKHSTSVPQTALGIEKIFNKAGFPENVVTTLLIDSGIADVLIEKDLVDGVSLTGSVGAGSRIGEIAGKQIKKTVMELGGSDAFIVLKDADIELAAKEGVKSRFRNAGQSCNAAKRFIVIKEVAEIFQNEMIKQMGRLKVGNPMDMDTAIGPLANNESLKILEMQIKDAVEKGAKIHYGRKIPEKGYFIRPAVLTNIKENMIIFREECFGPIAPIITVEEEKEAIRIANESKYGLGAAIWTKNRKKAVKIAKELNVGTVAINGIVRSDPKLPFGGVKKSGFGRELSEEGLKEFVNVKVLIVKK